MTRAMDPKTTNAKNSLTQLPLLLVIITLLIWSIFQTVQLFNERLSINTVYDNQENVIADAIKMRNQLNVISAGTKRLAEQGNANAQAIVEQLAKNGISINANAQDAAASK